MNSIARDIATALLSLRFYRTTSGEKFNPERRSLGRGRDLSTKGRSPPERGEPERPFPASNPRRQRKRRAARPRPGLKEIRAERRNRALHLARGETCGMGARVP